LHEVGRNVAVGASVIARRYGARWPHLAGHVVALALVVYAVSRVVDPRYSRGLNYVVWLVGGAVLYDLLLAPSAALLDRLLRRLGPAVNYVRFPAAISGAILLVYFPLIFAKSDRSYLRSTGHHVSGFAARWLLISAGLFAASALLYGVRRRWGRP
jgi:hypothetical protein